jgi:hypothetical protein
MTEPTLLSLIRQVRAQRRSQPDALEGERLRLEGSLIEFVASRGTAQTSLTIFSPKN